MNKPIEKDQDKLSLLRTVVFEADAYDDSQHRQSWYAYAKLIHAMIIGRQAAPQLVIHGRELVEHVKACWMQDMRPVDCVNGLVPYSQAPSLFEGGQDTHHR